MTSATNYDKEKSKQNELGEWINEEDMSNENLMLSIQTVRFAIDVLDDELLTQWNENSNQEGGIAFDIKNKVACTLKRNFNGNNCIKTVQCPLRPNIFSFQKTEKIEKT